MQIYKTPKRKTCMAWGGDAFLATVPKTQSMKALTDKLGFIKIKNFCSAKENVKTMRRHKLR